MKSLREALVHKHMDREKPKMDETFFQDGDILVSRSGMKWYFNEGYMVSHWISDDEPGFSVRIYILLALLNDDLQRSDRKYKEDDIVEIYRSRKSILPKNDKTIAKFVDENKPIWKHK